MVYPMICLAGGIYSSIMTGTQLSEKECGAAKRVFQTREVLLKKEFSKNNLTHRKILWRTQIFETPSFVIEKIQSLQAKECEKIG